ncbi:hypothetical protein [Shewanella baltica]|uniref:hypothetical protein n=1 Tax=Shewanella baltica TaxID=62322 RepID=UPI0001883F93|nr:hypothetical protein [Shewanella baltica]ACK48562.1 hypothetical protein Sbal223_4090 [Shewanella baltica OS223]
MTSLITKLVLSSEAGWGAAFRVNGKVEVYQQSLFWLLCKGIPFDSKDLKINYVLGTDVIQCQLETSALIELLDTKQIHYFQDESQIRWLLPHNVSTVFYGQWKSRTSAMLNTYCADYITL